MAALSEALAGAAEVASRLTIADARLMVTEHLASTDIVTALSLERFTGLWARFERFAERAHGIVCVSEVDAQTVGAFLKARTTTGGLPSVSTSQIRLAAVRLLFRVLRELRLAYGDPTLDLRVPRRRYPDLRALTDKEVEACRWASLATLVGTREPAVWALAEAGASTGEIGWVSAHNLDVDGARVWVAGGRKSTPRWLPLDEWGAIQLGRRARHLGAGSDGDLFLTYCGDGSCDSRRSSVTAVLTRILRQAGLARSTGVEPRSVSAWVGGRVLADTGRIDAVARRLGLRSLDLAADMVGWDWRGEAS